MSISGGPPLSLLTELISLGAGSMFWPRGTWWSPGLKHHTAAAALGPAALVKDPEEKS